MACVTARCRDSCGWPLGPLLCRCACPLPVSAVPSPKKGPWLKGRLLTRRALWLAVPGHTDPARQGRRPRSHVAREAGNLDVYHESVPRKFETLCECNTTHGSATRRTQVDSVPSSGPPPALSLSPGAVLRASEDSGASAHDHWQSAHLPEDTAGLSPAPSEATGPRSRDQARCPARPCPAAGARSQASSQERARSAPRTRAPRGQPARPVGPGLSKRRRGRI